MKKSKKSCKKKFCKACDNAVVVNGKAYCMVEVRTICPSFYPKEKTTGSVR